MIVFMSAEINQELKKDIIEILEQTLLVEDDVEENQSLPRRFRMYENCSGSAQFMKSQYENMKKKWPLEKNVIVVDLRQELHFFLGDRPVSFFNQYFVYNVGRDNIDELEKEISCSYFPTHYYRFMEKQKKRLQYFSILNKTPLMRECEVVDTGYKRFYVTDRRFPTPDVLDDFLLWVKQLPPDTWLHFHCRGGKGRTTTFMMLYDIWKTKASLPFAIYLKRQIDLGGTNLAFLKRKNEYLAFHTGQRFKMLRKFYQYIKTGSTKRWSEFVKSL